MGNTHNLDVKFQTPSVDFDRNLVRGRVIRLFTIREDKYARALEEVAASRLYSVIVETDAVATIMLKKRCFRHREVLIPNNKIASRDVPREIIDYVTQITDGKAIHAFQAIKFPIALEPAMKFVFGDAFICEDSETAKKVCFDPRVRMRCITLDGDTYSPSGVLTGGNDENQQGTCILKKVREIQRLEEDLRFAEHRLSEQRQELAKTSQLLLDQNDRQQKTEGMAI